MSVIANIRQELTVTSTIDGVGVGTRNKIIEDQFNEFRRLTGSTSPAVTKRAAIQQALTAGAATINLRVLVDLQGQALDLNGLKVQAFRIINRSDVDPDAANTNVNSLVVVPGASNGYNLLGASSKIILPPGASCTFYMPEGTPDVSNTVKNIDISDNSAGGTESYLFLFVAG